MNFDLKKYCFIFFSFNISLIPFFLVTGPFLPDLSLTLCSIIYLVYILYSKKFDVFKNYVFVFFIIFYFIILLSSILSENKLFSLNSSLPYIRFGLFIICVWHTAIEDSKLFKKIFVVLTIVYFALVLDGYLQFFTGTNILNYEKMGVRVSSFFGDELILGSYIVRFFPIYIGLYFFISQKKKIFFFEKILFILLIFLVSILVIISGERTAFALLLISLILMFLFLKGLKGLKIIFSLLLILTSFIFVSIYQKNFERLFIETRNQIFTNDKLLFFGERRHEYANVSINIFKENPFFGSGPKTYRIMSKIERYKISELSWNTHPHNTYFQLLAETGLIGILFVFFVFSYFVLNLFRIFLFKLEDNDKSNSYRNFKICIIIAILINIFPLMPSGNFFNNWLSIVYFYPIAIFCASNNSYKVHLTS